MCEDGVISTEPQLNDRKRKVVCDATILTTPEFSYLFSAESRQREERRARLPKIQSGDETVRWLRGNWARSACSQDQAGVLCHNKGRREEERKKEGRERGREGSRHAEGPDNWWRTPLLSFCCENRGRGKKRRGSGYREAGWMERKRRRESVLGVTLAVTSGNERSGGECTLSAVSLLSFYLSASKA